MIQYIKKFKMSEYCTCKLMLPISGRVDHSIGFHTVGLINVQIKWYTGWVALKKSRLHHSLTKIFMELLYWWEYITKTFNTLPTYKTISYSSLYVRLYRLHNLDLKVAIKKCDSSNTRKKQWQKIMKRSI